MADTRVKREKLNASLAISCIHFVFERFIQFFKLIQKTIRGL